MNRKTVQDAMDSANWFLTMAKVLMEDGGFDTENGPPNPKGDWLFHPSAKSGAVRRASMDLTRDLAAMRRPL